MLVGGIGDLVAVYWIHFSPVRTLRCESATTDA
jgi:hypothetical protein